MTTITLRQVQKLLAFFGGEDCEVVLTEQSQDGAGGSPGLYAHCAEYPEEGCKYLGPTEVDGEIAGADFRRMFGAAVASLAQISEALGIDEEEAACANGNELILKAIASKNAAILAAAGGRHDVEPPAVQRKASSLALRRLTLDEACEVAPDTMMSQSERGRTPEVRLQAPSQTTRDWLLFEHDDGRYAAAPNDRAADFTRGDPKWHRVGPVAIHGAQPESETVPAVPRPEHQQLMKFYGVDSVDALVDVQARSIERLQDRLSAAEGNPFKHQPVRKA